MSLETSLAFRQRSSILSSKAMIPSSPCEWKLMLDVKESTKVAVVFDLLEGIWLGLVEWDILHTELRGAKSSLVLNVVTTMSLETSLAFRQRSSILSSKAMIPSSPYIWKLVLDVNQSIRVAAVSDLFEGIWLGVVDCVMCVGVWWVPHRYLLGKSELY